MRGDNLHLWVCLQDWLNRNILEHPWLEHMHKHWCQQQFVYDKEAPMPKPAGSEPPKEAPAAPKPVSPAPKSAKSSVTRAKPVVPDALTLSADGILSYHDVADNEDVVVDRAVLQAVEGIEHVVMYVCCFSCFCPILSLPIRCRYLVSLSEGQS